LHNLNDEIASSKELLNSYHISSERKRQEAENLNNDISRLMTVINRFKNNNEEYLKIKHVAEENVKGVLTNRQILLNFATASVIESLRKTLNYVILY
jgi:CO dehydrogenase nickel-insertion accessory protein CooC1